MKAATPDHVRIVISRVGRRTEVEGLVANFERFKNSDAWTRPVFVGEENGYSVYTVRFSKSDQVGSKWRVRKLDDGTLLGFQDPGSFSGKFTGSRRVEDLEVSYGFSKALEVDPMEVDSAVVALVQKFASEPSVLLR